MWASSLALLAGRPWQRYLRRRPRLWLRRPLRLQHLRLPLRGLLSCRSQHFLPLLRPLMLWRKRRQALWLHSRRALHLATVHLALLLLSLETFCSWVAKL
jgi:hypothetical protein